MYLFLYIIKVTYLIILFKNLILPLIINMKKEVLHEHGNLLFLYVFKLYHNFAS